MCLLPLHAGPWCWPPQRRPSWPPPEQQRTTESLNHSPHPTPPRERGMDSNSSLIKTSMKSSSVYCPNQLNNSLASNTAKDSIQNKLYLSPRTVHQYLVLEVSVVLEDGPLIGSCPDVVLHHVLLLGEVAIELEEWRREREQGSERKIKWQNSLFFMRCFNIVTELIKVGINDLLQCMADSACAPGSTVLRMIPLSCRWRPTALHCGRGSSSGGYRTMRTLRRSS